MIRIFSDGAVISYSQGDTFSLSVESESGFEVGAKLNFQVAESEEKESVIDKIFEDGNSVFEITLTEEEIKKLSLGRYVYKIIIMGPDDSVITRKSGELEVRWGA